MPEPGPVNGGEPTARRRWDASDDNRMRQAREVSEPMALRLSKDPLEPEAIVADDATVIAATLERDVQPRAPSPNEIIDKLGARLLGTVSTDAPPLRLIDRLDPLGHTILYGAGGVGKGVVASDWLVKLRTSGVRVLIADYENHPDEWARRIYGLGGAHLLDGITVVTPLTAAWGGRRGPLWEQRGNLRALAAATNSDYLLVDSIVPACAGNDPLRPETAALYTGGLEYIGLPALSLAHVTKGDDLRYPFGSVFWHNLARITYSLERSGRGTVLVNRKANNYAFRPKHEITTTWVDGRPQEVCERPMQQVLSQRIRAVLEGGALTVEKIVEILNDELEDENDRPLKADSIRKTLNRGSRAQPQQFVKEGSAWKLG